MEITLADLHDFHLPERVVFTRLVYHLSRDPCKSLLAIAFWLWLEDDNGFSSICSILTQAPHHVLDSVFKEAVFCVNSLAHHARAPPPFWMTASVAGGAVPWRKMQENREATVRGIRYFVEDVCGLIFSDVLYRVYLEESDGEAVDYYEEVPVAGFPHAVVGRVRILRMHPAQMFSTENLWGWNW